MRGLRLADRAVVSATRRRGAARCERHARPVTLALGDGPVRRRGLCARVADFRLSRRPGRGETGCERRAQPASAAGHVCGVRDEYDDLRAAVLSRTGACLGVLSGVRGGAGGVRHRGAAHRRHLLRQAGAGGVAQRDHQPRCADRARIDRRLHRLDLRVDLGTGASGVFRFCGGVQLPDARRPLDAGDRHRAQPPAAALAHAGAGAGANRKCQVPSNK